MNRDPELRCFMNLMAFDSMRESAPARGQGFDKALEMLHVAGFCGVQFSGWGTAEELVSCRSMGMGFAASARVNQGSEAAAVAERLAGDGYECATLHAGWGLEDDSQAHAIIDGILTAANRWNCHLYIETHRATICQDMWRTVQFIRRFPAMRFNADFSHWYAGQEMVYGGFEQKVAFIQPVLDRVRYIHGRIASPGCIQVAVPLLTDSQPIYMDHFRQLWTAAFRGFLQDARRGSPDVRTICFAPELLGPEIYYARTFDGREESDRWQQSLLLNELARQCFTCAKSS